MMALGLETSHGRGFRPDLNFSDNKKEMAILVKDLVLN
jgi:hypothetical protein